MIIHKHKTVGQVIKRLALTILIMALVFTATGVAYVYFSGRNASTTMPKPVTSIEAKSPIPDPVMPGPNTPNGASVQYIESPVAAGSNTTINVHTGPNSECKIVVAYNEVLSKDTGLITKNADVHGSVSWTWTVDKTAPVGKWPVKVTCVRNNKTAFVQGDLVVTK